MKHKVEVMNLTENISMMGYVPNVKLYIKYFDLLLFTSDWEGLPLSIWEAMAVKVPVVSTDVGGIKEILESEDCGIIYPRGDIDKGVKAIMELLLDSKRRETMGENGYNAIKSKYNSEGLADFFNDLYTNL